MAINRLFVLSFLLFLWSGTILSAQVDKKPNIVFILVDQWRAQATGYSGDQNAITPNLDRLASVSINMKNAVSVMPACTPYRASLLTGQYPTTNGVFMNDVMLDTNKITIAKVVKEYGYKTGYIGKWHIDGHGRENYIPESRRQGFEYWKALECTHDYNNSPYFHGNSDEKLVWDGYDALAQAEDACQYIEQQSGDIHPFMLFISLGPPHAPYQTAPEKYRNLYKEKDIKLNENVPAELHDKAQEALRGYYSHIAAIDEGIGKIWETIRKSGIENNTIFIFTSDHGDLLGAHGNWHKRQPFEESIRVPFLIHYPAVFGKSGRISSALINAPDIMPTLLGLSNIPVPRTVEGVDFSGVLKGTKKDRVKQTLITCVQPFGQWKRAVGGKEYRGVVTDQYTYVKDLNGPWLFFDNKNDPFQLNNLVNNSKYARKERKMEHLLKKTLKRRKDEFLPGMHYVKKWDYVVDKSGSVPYREINYQGKPIVP